MSKQDLESYAVKASQIRLRFSEAATTVELKRIEAEHAKKVGAGPSGSEAEKEPMALKRGEISKANYKTWMEEHNKVDARIGPLPTESLRKALDVVKRRSKSKVVRGSWCSKPDTTEKVTPGRRRKRRRRNHLDLSDKLQIVHQVLVQNDTQAAVA